MSHLSDRKARHANGVHRRKALLSPQLIAAVVARSVFWVRLLNDGMNGLHPFAPPLNAGGFSNRQKIRFSGFKSKFVASDYANSGEAGTCLNRRRLRSGNIEFSMRWRNYTDASRSEYRCEGWNVSLIGIAQAPNESPKSSIDTTQKCIRATGLLARGAATEAGFGACQDALNIRSMAQNDVATTRDRQQCVR